MEKPVLILDYSVDRRSGDNIGRWFKEPLCVLRIRSESPFPALDPSCYSAVVHSGSALSITDSHPFLEGAREFIRSSTGSVPQMASATATSFWQWPSAEGTPWGNAPRRRLAGFL